MVVGGRADRGGERRELGGHLHRRLDGGHRLPRIECDAGRIRLAVQQGAIRDLHRRWPAEAECAELGREEHAVRHGRECAGRPSGLVRGSAEPVGVELRDELVRDERGRLRRGGGGGEDGSAHLHRCVSFDPLATQSDM